MEYIDSLFEKELRVKDTFTRAKALKIQEANFAANFDTRRDTKEDYIESKGRCCGFKAIHSIL